MPLSPPTLTWHISFAPINAMSAGHALAQGVVMVCRIGGPATLYLLSVHVGPQAPPSTSEIQTLPLYPTPQPSSRPGDHDRITSPGVAGVPWTRLWFCLLYTSDAADERSSVDL